MELKEIITHEEEKRDVKQNIDTLLLTLERIKNGIENDEIPDVTKSGIIRDVECAEIIVRIIQNKVKGSEVL